MMRRPAVWALLWLALWTCLAPARAQDRAQVQRIDVMQVGGQPRALPDTWTEGHAADYEAELPAIGGSGPLALYLERVCSQVQVRLDDRVLWDSGPLSSCHRPLLLPLAPGSVDAPGRRLTLSVRGEPLDNVASRLQAGGLSEVWIGPQAQLARWQARDLMLKVEAPQALAASLLLMGGFLFVLGWRHREQSHLAYFGALCIGWALVDARRWLPALPLTDAVAEFLQSALLALVTLAAVQFLLRQARWRSRPVWRLLLLQCVLMPATLVAAGPSRLHALGSLWMLVFALEIAAAAAFHLRLRQRLGGRLPPLATAALGTVGPALAVQAAGRTFAMPDALVHGAGLVAPLGLLLVGLRLVRQHGRALQSSEHSRVNLEARVREATAEIERNFRQITELRVEQVTERERKRIAGDLHDDLGAKLLTIVHTSEDPRISTLAREALEEMRLSVRGLTGRPVRLADALGDWRAELMSRLSQAGILGDWESPDDLPQTLSARAYVQTTRILRESTSNIIKHSGASQCSFTCSIAEGDLQLVIQDNGNGIPLELDGRLDRGHGMASMKHRAKQMQGQCLVESGPGFGTVIRLTLPLDQATQPGP